MTKAYLLDVLERTIRTFAQTAVALVGTNAIGLTDVDWLTVVSGAGLAALLAVLTALGSMSLGSTPNDASIL